MNCQKCGSPLVPGDKFCKTCGSAVGQDSTQMMNQMQNGMENQMNNNMMMQDQNQMQNPMNNNMQQEHKQHPLMMDQSALNVNAMSMNSHMNMNMNDPMQNETINMGNNQFVPSNNMNSMDNTMTNMSPMNNMDNSMGGMNQMNNMNGMGMGMDNSMNNMNQIPQPMSVPTGMNNMMNTPMNIGPMGAMTPKNNNSKFILAGIAIVVVILVAIFLVGGTDSQKGKEIGKNNGEEEKDVPTYTVQLSGFSFKVPQTYIYEITNGYLMMTDESNEWIIRISTQKASYESLKTNRAQIKPTLEKKGCTAEAAELKTYNGIEIIKFNFESSGIKYNAGYAKINSMYLATIEGFNKDNTYDEDLLKKATAIVKTAEYVGETANMQIAIPDGAINALEAQYIQ